MPKLRRMPSPPNDYAILLVDDFRSGITPLQRRLENDGVRVLAVLSADAALRLLETERISVVVSDWNMPVRDGISLLDEVEQRWPKVERILYSGDFDAERVLEAHGKKHRVLDKGSLGTAAIILRRHRAFLRNAT